MNKEDFSYLRKKKFKNCKYCGKDNVKRRKITIEGLIEYYAEVFMDAAKNGKIKFCGIEKCKIDTKEGVKVVKEAKGYIRVKCTKTRNLLVNLEKRGFIRKSKIMEESDESVRKTE